MSDTSTQKPPKRVALYIRVSTDEQSERYGPDIQKEAIMNLIKAREGVNEPLVFAGEEHVYFDDGISGTTELEERPQFARLKEAIELAPEGNKPFDAVAVYRIDRFARKLKVLLNIVDFFEDNDIKFLSVNESIDTSSPFGKAILNIIGVIAELEIETIKERTQAGREQAVKRGVYMGNNPPYGYVKNEEKKLEIHDEEAKNVRKIFDLYVNQKNTTGEIQNYLKEHKVLSPAVAAIRHGKREGGTKKENSSFHWPRQSVLRVLKRELYVGKYYHGKYKDGEKLPRKEWKLSPYSQPQIIDDLTFEKAQKQIEESKHRKDNRSKREHDYLLRGLLRCDTCYDSNKQRKRQHWIGTSKKVRSTGEHSYYYHCGRKSTSKYENTCDVLPMPAEEIEEYVANQCLELLKSPVAVFKHQQELKSSQVETKRLEKKMEEASKMLAAISPRKERLREQHEHGYLSTSELKEQMNEVSESEKKYIKELKNLKKQLAENTLSDGYIKALDLFDEKYQKMLKNIKDHPKEISEMLHLLIDEIIVYSRPVTDEDSISGRKKEGQMIPNRLHVKLKLPQDILNEIGKQEAVLIEKAPSKGTSSSQDNNGGGRCRT